LKGCSFPFYQQARQAGAGLALSALLTVAFVGCDAGLSGSGERVRLVLTPVATPTPTSPAMPTVPPVTYIVRSGDTLWGIANLFGVGVDDIVRANNIADPSTLAEGQALTIPGRSVSPMATPEAPGTATLGAGETPAAAPTAEGGSTGTSGVAASPTLPPPDATPPQGPTIAEPTQPGSSPGPNFSPTVVP
jgi:LysM repeat protein